MNNLQWPAANLDMTLNRRRQRRDEYRSALTASVPVRRFPSASLTFWFFLSGASMLWALLPRQAGGHGIAIMMAIALASFLSSIAGFAFSAICGAMLFHLDNDTVQIVQLMIICSIANQATMTWAGRRDIDWRGIRVYFSGGLVGLPIGVWTLLNVERTLYTRVFGALLLSYGAYMLLRKAVVIRRKLVAADFITGFLGGVTGGAAGFPGAFVTIWCGMKGWDKARQRAVFQPFILVMQVAALLAISRASRSGAGGFGLGPQDLLFIPAALFGTAFGLALYRQ